MASMSNVASMLLFCVVLLACLMPETEAKYRCFRDQECVAQLETLKCDTSSGFCVCKAGYSQEEVQTSGFYRITCKSMLGAGAIAAIVIVVGGLLVAAIVVTIIMKKKRMACFA